MIGDHGTVESVSHIPRHMNMADLASKDRTSMGAINKYITWLQGPTFLKDPRSGQDAYGEMGSRNGWWALGSTKKCLRSALPEVTTITFNIKVTRPSWALASNACAINS